MKEIMIIQVDKDRTFDNEATTIDEEVVTTFNTWEGCNSWAWWGYDHSEESKIVDIGMGRTMGEKARIVEVGA